MILQRQLPGTPSLAAEAKRDLFNEFTAYAAQVKSAKYTDIRRRLAQASFELKQRPSRNASSSCSPTCSPTTARHRHLEGEA